MEEYSKANLIAENARLKARLAEVEAELLAATVLEIDFTVRDRIIAVARGEGTDA